LPKTLLASERNSEKNGIFLAFAAADTRFAASAKHNSFRRMFGGMAKPFTNDKSPQRKLQSNTSSLPAFSRLFDLSRISSRTKATITPEVLPKGKAFHIDGPRYVGTTDRGAVITLAEIPIISKVTLSALRMRASHADPVGYSDAACELAHTKPRPFRQTGPAPIRLKKSG
jgi:hypothetical protein